jgi:putative FmdB family regulatory protein
MPTYTFLCNKCGQFETHQGIKDYTGKCKCPTCKKTSSQRVYENDIPNGFVKLATSELRTLGHLAERNAETMSADEKAALHHKHNEYKHGTSSKALPAGMSRLRNADGSLNEQQLKVKNVSKRSKGRPRKGR